MTNKKQSFFKALIPNVFQIVVLILAVVAAFYVGKLSTEVKFYREGLANVNQLGQGPEAQAPEPEAYQPIDASTFTMPGEGDHIKGNADANIAIVEYSDFDCPYCGSFHETATRIVNESDGEVMWIYRHFPLEQLHPDAFTKAAASECAYNLGGDDAFWAFSDEIFASYSGTNLDDDDYTQIANDLNINSTQLLSCINNGDTDDRVNKDLDEGNTAGVRGTPGNYVVNIATETIIPLRGAEPYENVQGIIESVK
jgi:protein-disulfide isomerase